MLFYLRETYCNFFSSLVFNVFCVGSFQRFERPCFCVSTLYILHYWFESYCNDMGTRAWQGGGFTDVYTYQTIIFLSYFLAWCWQCFLKYQTIHDVVCLISPVVMIHNPSTTKRARKSRFDLDIFLKCSKSAETSLWTLTTLLHLVHWISCWIVNKGFYLTERLCCGQIRL